VLVPGFVSHLELAWEHPPYGRFMRQLAAFTPVIVFDKRGAGLSDPVGEVETIEERVDDIRAVSDAAATSHPAPGPTVWPLRHLLAGAAPRFPAGEGGTRGP
jgi:pimeloyl-ACP methyl ester carboxylesterase